MAQPSGLGAFGGVYTPSILTILGVIMYLRFGWVVGNVGLVGALAIVTLSTAITFLAVSRRFRSARSPLTALCVLAVLTERGEFERGLQSPCDSSLGM